MARSRIIPEGGTAGQVLSKVDGDDHNVEWTTASGGGGGGLLFELDTTTTDDVATTTECEAESGPAGLAPAGTLTPTANVAAPWGVSTDRVITFAADASHAGVHVRRILTGTLPAAGYILDVGIADLGTGSFTSYPLVMIAYQQNTGTAFTGLGFRMAEGSGTLSLIGVGNDGSGAPYTPVNSGVGLITASLTGAEFDRGPIRLIFEIRKVDAQTPAEWHLRVTMIAHFDYVQTIVYSGVIHPMTGFPTGIDSDGWAPTRVGIGIWNDHGATAEAASVSVSHLRVYELGPGSVGGGPGIDELTADVTAGPGSGAQAATVVALRGRSIHTAAPSDGDVLTWNNASTRWEPSAASGGLGNYAVRKRSMVLSRGGR